MNQLKEDFPSSLVTKNNAGNLRYRSLDFFMLRLPLLPIDVYFNILSSDRLSYSKQIESISKMIENPIITEAIAVSSESLLQSLPNLQEDSLYNKKKIQTLHGISRYLLRMSTRATPFGLCSGVTNGRFGNEAKVVLPSITDFKKRARPDMEWLLKIVMLIESKREIVKQLYVKANDNIYLHGNTAKLHYHTNYGQNYKDQYNHSIKVTNILKDVLNIAEDSVNFGWLVSKVMKLHPKLKFEETQYYLWELLKGDFLISNLRLPLMSISPFNYLLNQLDQIQGIDDLKEQLYFIQDEIQKFNSLKIGNGEKTYLSITSLMKGITEVETPLQVDLSMEGTSVNLPENIKSDVEKAAELIWRLSPGNNENEFHHLQQYHKEFIKEYGFYREIPLSQLLDEEIGLGPPATYKNPISHRSELSSMSSINTQREAILQKIVFKSIVEKSVEIELTEEILQELEQKIITDKELPPSMELYFSIASPSAKELSNGNYTMVMGANPGSSGAGRTFGRFSDLFDEKFNQMLQSINDMEQDLYPDILFTEVVYTPSHGRKANVVISENIRSYELAINTNSSKSKEFTIPISDIVVGANSCNLYLKSKSQNKEIITTTGHRLSALHGPNVYRFIREVSLNRFKTWSRFNWGALKGAPFLPRLKCGRIIISPAEWNLSKTIMLDFKSEEKWSEKIKLYRKQWSTPRFLYLTKNDKRILLDLENQLHLDILEKDFNKLDSDDYLHLVEPGYNTQEECWISSPEGYYVGEFTFPLIKKDKSHLRNNNIFESNTVDLTKQKKYFPGSKWLYLKIYGMENKLDSFSGKPLLELFKLVQQEDWCSKFYFIKYKDPKSHVRIRIKGNQENLNSEGLKIINKWAKMLQKDGFISHMVLDTYIPELERYGGPKLIELAESIFEKDSLVACEWFKLNENQKNKLDKELFCVLNIINWLECFNLSFEEQLNWINQQVNYKSYLKEFRERKKIFLYFGNSNNNWSSLNSLQEGKAIFELFLQRKNAINKYLKELEHTSIDTDIKKIIKSFIHMSLNRIIGIDIKKEKMMFVLARHTLYNLRFFKLQE